MTNVPAPDAKTVVKNLVISSIRPLFFVVLAVGVFWFIFNQIGDEQSILTQLNDTATARGLITFVVAISTVAGALILVLASIISEGTENDVKMRLNEGRQVLAPLIGVLGTIVGFYFGQAAPPSGQSGAGTAGQAQALRIAAMTLSPEQVAAGGPVTVTGTASGGRGPYTYSITLPGLAQPATGKTEGSIQQVVTIPTGTKPPEVTIQLEIKDSAGASAKAERPLKIGGS